MTERWEYWSGIIYANAEEPKAKDFIAQKWPEWKAPRNAPQAMMPELNNLGKQGWELVHMEPVPAGHNQDIRFGGEGYIYSSAYFCVFKRKLD